MNTQSDFIQKINTTIDNNFRNYKFNVEQLASELSIDRSTLFRLCIKHLNTNPTTYLRNLRLQTAKNLLLKNISVSEVANMTGFDSLSYFSSQFKNKYGVSPSKLYKKGQFNK
jgi:AraC-like DNA-binding protein